MSEQEIVIPWRDSGDAMRLMHFEFLSQHYTKHGFSIIIGDNEGPFNRSAARNAGVEKATGDVVIVMDADNYIPLSQLDLAVELAIANDRLVKPFYKFGYLTAEATEALYLSYPAVPQWSMTAFIDTPKMHFNGGAYVMKRELWWKVGGFDPDFTGWGCEDDAFTLECERVLGTTNYVGGYAYHLDHPAVRISSPDNYNVLMTKYVIPYKDKGNAS